MLDAESGGSEKIGFVADTVGLVGGAVGGAAAGLVGIGPSLVTTQTQFSVDPEQAQKLIDGLTEARNRLQELNRDAFQLQAVGSPGKDPHSAMVAEAIRQAAGGDVGGYGVANKAAYEALTVTIQKIQTSLAAYRDRDEANADAFKAGGSSR